MKKNIQYSIFNIQYSACSPCRGLALSMSKGFTVVELLVTMIVFSVLTGVVLARYRDYATSASFANASEDIVMALRQAQVYGAGGKQNITDCGGSEYMCHYGVSFIEDNNFFTMFADSDNNQIFNPGDTVIETMYFKSPTFLYNVECQGTPCTNGLNIVFVRPYTDAWIADMPTDVGIYGSYDFGTITISNGKENNIIKITRAGQISIQ